MINESHYASDLIRVSWHFITKPCFQVVFVIVECFLEVMCNSCGTCTMNFVTDLECAMWVDFSLSVKLLLANYIL